MNASEALGLDLNILARDLGVWATRDDTKAQPEVREAVNSAMCAIDLMLAGLYRVRSQLVTEIRQSDDATAARVDAMLAEQPMGVIIRPVFGRRTDGPR